MGMQALAWPPNTLFPLPCWHLRAPKPLEEEPALVWPHSFAHTRTPVLLCVHISALSPFPPLAASLVQAGLIRTDSTDYFIEPVERGQQEMEAGGRKHVVYRREVIRQPWTEPLGDLHNEGRLWLGVPGLPPSTSQGCFQVTSGLGFSTPGLSLLTGVMALGHIDLLHQQGNCPLF